MQYYLLIVPALSGVVAIATGWLPFKLAVPGLCALLVYLLIIRRRRSSRDGWWIVIAFGFSMIGDSFLSLRGDDDMLFVYGIAGFFVAHLGYLGYALSNGSVRRPVLLGLYAGYLPFYLGWLAPEIDDVVLSGAVLVYLLISCLVLAAAAGLNLSGKPKALYGVGITSIVVSDTFIALNEFVGVSAFSDWVLPTYYLAHLTVTASLMARAGHHAQMRESMISAA